MATIYRNIIGFKTKIEDTNAKSKKENQGVKESIDINIKDNTKKNYFA